MLFDDANRAGTDEFFDALDEGFVRCYAETFRLEHNQVVVTLLKVEENFSLAWSGEDDLVQLGDRGLAHAV